jgi:hypothetical protein
MSRVILTIKIPENSLKIGKKKKTAEKKIPIILNKEIERKTKEEKLYNVMKIRLLY